MIEIDLPWKWAPRGYQMRAWEYMEGGGRHCELVWHRRSGKDELSYRWTSKSMFMRVGNYWHMLPQANQARKALWDAVNPHSGLRRVDEAFPREIRARVNDHEMMIGAINGSTWQVVGSDNFNSLVGSPPVGIVFSEWALCDPASWAYLSPILEENGGWAIFNTTPRGRNHAFMSYRAASQNPLHYAERLDATQTDVFSAEQLREIERNLVGTYGVEFGRSIYEQEYLCSFDAANMGAILGRYVGEAEREGRILDLEPDYGGAPIEISSDIGYRDTAAWWFWQPKLGGFDLVSFDSDSGLDAEEWIERLKKRCTELGVKLGRIWLPVDAKAKTFATRHSPMERFLEAFGTEVVRVVPATKKLDQVNAARYVIGSCRFNKVPCEKGLDALAAWSFRYDEDTKDFSRDPLHDWSSHAGDAYAYGALVMRERIAEEKKKVEPIRGQVVYMPGLGFRTTETFDELWREHDSNSRRTVRV